MPGTSPRIAESYAAVRRIARRSRSNFYRSFWLLPRDKRRAMYALYAFARVTDDLGDCTAPATLRKDWLACWRQTAALNLIAQDDHAGVVFPHGFPQSTGDWPVDVRRRGQELLPALADAVRRFDIPTRYLLEIIDGVIADQRKTRFDTFEQLEHYCYLVASSVGLACMHIWGFTAPLPTQAAIDCGVAFQLTNILRDIGEDARLGRIYLPQQHWHEHGLCEDDLLQPRADDRLRCLILDETCRAQRLFASGWDVWPVLHRDGQRMFSMMWRTYQRLLSEIQRDPCSVFRRRVGLSLQDKTMLTLQHFVTPLFCRLSVPPREIVR